MATSSILPNFFGDANKARDWRAEFSEWLRAFQQHPDRRALYLDYLLDWSSRYDNRPIYILLYATHPKELQLNDGSYPSFLDIVERCLPLMTEDVFDRSRCCFLQGTHTFMAWSPFKMQRYGAHRDLETLRCLQAVFDSVFYAWDLRFTEYSEHAIIKEEREHALAALGYPKVWSSYEQSISSLGEPLRISSLYELFKGLLHIKERHICLPGMN